jgi:dihydrofolate reductase
MMQLTMLVAVSENGVIGVNNDLPWRLPEDLKFFKRNTMGKPIFMGRKTFESLGKPLPGRIHIVLSRNAFKAPEGVIVCNSIEDGLVAFKQLNQPELCIIGGGHIFTQMMPIANQLIITKVHTKIEDKNAVHFPNVNWEEWTLIWEEAHEKDEKHPYSYTFQKYNRI